MLRGACRFAKQACIHCPTGPRPPKELGGQEGPSPPDHHQNRGSERRTQPKEVAELGFTPRPSHTVTFPALPCVEGGREEGGGAGEEPVLLEI